MYYITGLAKISNTRWERVPIAVAETKKAGIDALFDLYYNRVPLWRNRLFQPDNTLWLVDPKAGTAWTVETRGWPESQRTHEFKLPSQTLAEIKAMFANFDFAQSK
jgi:hypothetical protein